MKQFTYTVKTPRGMHCVPAGLLTKQAKVFPDTTVTITKGDQTVRLGQLLKLIAMNIRQGDCITLRCYGPHAQNALDSMGWCLCGNL